MTTFKYGDRVRFTANALGVVDPAQPYAFLADTVGEGDTGTIIVAEGLPEGWLAAEADSFPGKYVPVHPGMVEAA